MLFALRIFFILTLLQIKPGWTYTHAGPLKATFQTTALEEEEEEEEEEELPPLKTPPKVPTPPSPPVPSDPKPNPTEVNPPVPEKPVVSEPIPTPPKEPPKAPAQPAPKPKKKEKPDPLSFIYGLSEQTLCPFICDPPAFFSPILCGILEVKNQCLEKCKGVKYLKGKKTVNLKACQKKKSEPFVNVARKTLDNFCFFACNRIACGDRQVPIFIPKVEGKALKGIITVNLPWPGRAFAHGICANLCNLKKIENCMKEATGFQFEVTDDYSKPVELP